MELTGYLDSLRDDLLAAAALGDEDTQRAAALLTTAVEPAARLMLMSALSDLATEVSALLPASTVDVSLRGRDLRVTVSDEVDPFHSPGWSFTTTHTVDPAADHSDDADLGQAMREAGDELSRTTLRLVNRLKSQAERAATIQGVSLNTYIQRAVADAVRAAGRRPKRSSPQD